MPLQDTHPTALRWIRAKPRHSANPPEPTRSADTPPPFVVPAKAGTQKVPRYSSLTTAPPLTPSLLSTHSWRPDTDLPPQHFEHTVLDLLENMGYGHARHVGPPETDIDGITTRIPSASKGSTCRPNAGPTRSENPKSGTSPAASTPTEPPGASSSQHPTSPTQPERPPRPSPSEPSTSASSTATSSPTSYSNTASVSHPTPPPTFPKPGRKPPHPPHLSLRHTGDGRYPERRGGSLSSLLSTHS